MIRFFLASVLFITVTINPAVSGSEPAQTSRLNGFDVSHFQGEVDWEMVKEANVHFAYVKATEGIYTLDARLAENWKGANKAGLHVGVYHFFHPKEDPVKQAQHFLTQLKDAGIDLRGALPPVLDAEISENVKPATFHKDILVWLHAVEKAAGCKPILYTAPNFWDREDTSPLHGHGLWLADYASTPNLPKGWSNWTFWQHTQGGTLEGVSTKVDLNYFAGSHEDIERLKCR